MEESKSSLIQLGSHSLARAKDSIAVTNKLLIERNSRDRLEAEYHYHLGIKRKPWETLIAIEDFTNAIRLDSTNSLYYSERGLYKSFVSDLEGSIKDYEKAIAINPTSGLYVTVGDLRVSNDEYEKAVIEYTNAATITPEAAEVYYKRGMARTNLKYYEEAINDYTKAIECQKANCPC